MALSEKQVQEIVKFYEDGNDVNAIADTYKITAAAVRYQLKKEGTYKTDAADAPQSNADLGIEEDVAPTVDLDALMKNPALAALIERAVNARVSQLTAAPASAPVANGDTTAVVKAIEHLLEVQSQQMPGYIKPLSAEEVDRRSAALIEMKALIQDCKRRGDAPHYILGPQGLFDSTAVVHYGAGSEIRTYLEPVEDFVPMNDSARRIHEALIRSLGGHTPEIGTQIAEAMLAAKATTVPLVGAPATGSSDNRVEVIANAKLHDVSPKRVMGTSVPEMHGTSMPVQPGITQQPVGPSFVG